MTIRAVLFDLGETLWHIPDAPPVEKIREETVRRIFALLRSWGVEPEGELHFLGRDIRLAIGEADSKAYQSDCVSPHFPTVVGKVAAAKGLDLTPEQSEQLWEAWNLGGPFFGRRLFDDATEALETLRDRGYRLGCVTNRAFGGPAFVNEVEEHGLADFFEVVSVSCDLGYMKPHPKIFQHALDALGVPPEETVMVGDSLGADVAGAQALGMTAVWRPRPTKHGEIDGVQPDFVVDELRAIPELPCFRADGRSSDG
jgi:putative hydrolase of the HAD superfamily